MSTAPSAAPAIFPFTALVGQSALQRALLLTAVDPGIGGVLISGPRGTAKSTAARALAALLPGEVPLDEAAPFVTLPLSASLEQLVGTLNVEDALREGQVRLAPGLLARAHGGVLYVDEVNLLPDGLVDALLDVAASGVNIVERDGISQQHPARFVLVGTMNPEEGELRPQLLDRFGLSVTLENPRDPALRQAILRTRLTFDEAPQALIEAHAPQLVGLGQQVARARLALPGLGWSDEVLAHAARLAIQAGVDGMRADLVMLRAARAHAALDGRSAVSPADVDAVANLALAHRRTEADATPPAATRQQQPPPPAAGGPKRPPSPASGGQEQPSSSVSRGQEQSPSPASAGQEQPPPTASGGHEQASPEAASAAAGLPEGDWGALPPEPEATTRVVATGAWPAKKA